MTDLAPKSVGTENAFFVYRNAHKADLLTAGKHDRSKLTSLGERWKALSAEDKAPFEETAKKNKDENAARFETWKAKHPDQFAQYEAARAVRN
jgi:hypothetical protein